MFRSLVVLLFLATPALSIEVRQMPDTPKSKQLNRADMLANKGFFPPVCAEHQKVCTFTGLGGEVWVWEGYARAMLMQGKTLRFKGKCMSACYLAYKAAMDISPARVQVAPNTVFYRHTPYKLRE